MLSCTEVGRLADAFVDREVLPAVRACLLEHIQACRDCAALIEDKVQLKRLVRASVMALAVPAYLLHTVRQKIGAESWKDLKGKTY